MPEKKEIFEKIGINVSDDNINIDLGKTKDFFNSLQNTLEEKAETIEKDLSEGKIAVSYTHLTLPTICSV
mgnify:CR=1 FL=1